LCGLEQFDLFCSGAAVVEDKPGKQAEAGDAVASSMQADAAWRRRRQAERYSKGAEAGNAAALSMQADAARRAGNQPKRYRLT